MSDDDALRAAIVANPDADLPRLVYADFIHEAGDEAGAEFIRAQVELANTPEYDPFAVYCHAHRPEWVTGEDRRATLPDVTGLEWMPDRLFRRGFGWQVAAPFLPSLLTQLPKLRAREPVQSLALGTHPLDQLEQMALAPWLPDIREVSFTGLSTPIEPVRVLCATPAATGLRALHFTRGDSPAMPLLLERIFAAPLGRGLTTLSIRFSTEQSRELIEGLAGGAEALTDLTLRSISWPWNAVQVLVGSGVLGRLKVLRLTDSYLSAGCVEDLAGSPHAAGLEVLDFQNTSARLSTVEILASSQYLTGLRKLNLNDNALGTNTGRLLASAHALGGLRSLLLRQADLGDLDVQHLVTGAYWKNLAELDLTRNPIHDDGGKALADADTPPEMTALRLSVNRFSEPVRAALVAKYGPAVRFVPDGG